MIKNIKFAGLLVLALMSVQFIQPSKSHAADWNSWAGYLMQQYGIADKINTAINDAADNILDRLLPAKATAQSGRAAAPSYGDNAKVLAGKTIALDPGHGGNNPGAVQYGFREADNNLAVALKVQQLLTASGADVVMTRTTDVNVAPVGVPLSRELQARLDIAAQRKADIFVSLHTNSNENSNIDGIMTFYNDGASRQLADAIQRRMISQTNGKDKGVAQEGFYVLRNNNVPAVLVEMGFISNKAEAQRLATDAYRNELAVAIAAGIIEYFNG